MYAPNFKRTLLVAALLSSSATSCAVHDDGWTPTIEIRSNLPLTNTTTALTNVRVFDGFIVHKPSTVTFNGDGILSIDSDATKGHFDTIIDGANGVLIPGLIDSHCHPETLQHLSTLASFGVTTAFNMACFNMTVCNHLRNQPGLTSIFTSGIPATAPNSTHARLPGFPQTNLVSTPAEGLGFISATKNGSDWVKLIAEANGMDTATHVAVVAAAHAAGLRTHTHAADFASYEQAITSGSNGIEHSSMDALLTGDMIAAIRVQHQSVTPTLTIPKLGGVPPNSTLVPFTWANSRSNVMALHEVGIPILAGTDANDVVVANITLLPIFFGSSLHDELANLVDAGWSVAEALRAATEVPSSVYNLQDRGAIRVGLRADLVLLQGNPLVGGINETQNVVGVWIAGVKWSGL